MLQHFSIFNHRISEINEHKSLITTINAHCYNLTKTDMIYKQALLSSDILIPDGISVVWAMNYLTGEKLRKIAGADLFFYELERLQIMGGKCFFLGSKNIILNQIKQKINLEYPNIKVDTYSPPYKSDFSEQDDEAMLKLINAFEPDVLMIGMTAPKQEKWAYKHYKHLQVGHICCIGAVFDFYAGTINRAPQWMINLGMEWFYRLIKEPRRMWQRYLIGNIIFIYSIVKEKIKGLD